MFFDHIEKLKREYTDQYVVVDDRLPELRRFAGWSGRVKTVNMSGKALVEFGKLENIGWYDIDVDFLKIVDKPVETEAEEKPAAKSPAKPAATTAEERKAPAKMSVADILAAARGDAAASAETPAKPSPTAEVQPAAPAAAQPPTESKSKSSSSSSSKMSVADILAAARSEKSAAEAPAVAPVEANTPAPAAEEAPAEPPQPKAASEAAAAEELPTTTDAIVDWCRARDGA